MPGAATAESDSVRMVVSTSVRDDGGFSPISAGLIDGTGPRKVYLTRPI